jgi:hypothetical protein
LKGPKEMNFYLCIHQGYQNALRQRTDNIMTQRKSTNNDLQSTAQKTKIEQQEPHKTPGMGTGTHKR